MYVWDSLARPMVYTLFWGPMLVCEQVFIGLEKTRKIKLFFLFWLLPRLGIEPEP